ncbi:MAG: hypothetical protein IT319_12615 [Anaerolineae bacterium]|nr:hypothetical protein [Anaerolineae bacterium]
MTPNISDAQASQSKPRRFRLTWRRVGCAVLAVPCAVVGVFVLFITLLSPPVQASAPRQPFPDGFQKGISYESFHVGEFSSADSDRTLAEIAAPTGADWLAVIVTCYQDTIISTEISCADDVATASDADLRHVIQRAHDLGLKVNLKPHVDPIDHPDATTGRFNIGFGTDEAAWAAWFDSYTRMITHFAVIAEETRAEYFTIGTELQGTVHRADEWREIIRQVRAVYHGPLTYASLAYVEPLQVTWWDEMDAIGVDAYFGVTLTKSPTLAQMKLGWLPTVTFLDGLSQNWDKPIIITEVGYMSVDGTNILPGFWSLQGDIDLQEQADAYQAFFESFQGKPWWEGVFWWSLSTDPNQGGATDTSYSFHDKPAEAVLKHFFSDLP